MVLRDLTLQSTVFLDKLKAVLEKEPNVEEQLGKNQKTASIGAAADLNEAHWLLTD